MSTRETLIYNVFLYLLIGLLTGNEQEKEKKKEGLPVYLYQ